MNLAERLGKAAEIGKVSQKELARIAGISEGAVSKLFSGKSREIKAAHLFPIARRCHVDPEWLASGRGQAQAAGGIREKRATYDPKAEFEPKHIDLLRMYKRLPKEARAPIRTMIETLAAAQREDYATWIRAQRALIEEEA